MDRVPHIKTKMHMPDLKKFPFSTQTTNDFQENFAQIHLPDWQFYLPQAVRQWLRWPWMGKIYVQNFKYKSSYNYKLVSIFATPPRTGPSNVLVPISTSLQQAISKPSAHHDNVIK